MRQPSDQGWPLPDLVHALYEVAAASRRLARSGPVEPALARVLVHVRRLGEPRPSELAAVLDLDLSTVSRHLRALQDSGHLTTRRDDADGRAQRVVLTAAGAAALDEVVQHRCDGVARAVQDWSDEDRSTLAALLHRLADDLSAAGAEPAGPDPTDDPSEATA